MKWLSILALLVALPAQGAISLKDWEKKSDADQLNYLGFCVVGLTAEVAKTDPALALKIKNYYGDKPPGQKYTDGIVDLMTSIVHLEQQAKEGKADLSKIQVEDIVYNVTAEKFKLAPREAPQELGDFKDAAPHPAPADKPAAKARSNNPPQKSDNDDPFGPGGFIRPPDYPTSDSERVAPPPASPIPKPFMVGRIDVSHFAGLKPGDTEARVISLYGRADLFNGIDNGIPKRYDRGQLTVSYVHGIVKRVQVYSKDLHGPRSRVGAGNDAVLDFFGHTEADVIALLGPPKRRDSIENAAYVLSWTFAMPDRSAEYADQANVQSGQTLMLGMRTSGGCCYSMIVTW